MTCLRDGCTGLVGPQGCDECGLRYPEARPVAVITDRTRTDQRDGAPNELGAVDLRALAAVRRGR